MLPVARNPAQSFLVHLACTLANSIYPAIIAGTFRVFIKPGAKSQILEGPGKLALRAAVQVQARELSSKLRAHKAIAHTVEIIFEVKKTATQPNIAGEINPVRRERSGPVALLLQSFA